MAISYSDIFAPATIEPGTINGAIYLRPSVIAGLYLLGVVIFAIRLWARRHTAGLRPAMKEALAVSFCGIALLFAFLDEIVWFRWQTGDLAQYGGKSAAEKQAVANGGLQEFVSKCRQYLGAGNYELYPASPDDTISDVLFRLEYDLLPARKVAVATHIMVMGDRSVRYDEKLRLFSGPGGIRHAELLCRSGNFYLLRVQK